VWIDTEWGAEAISYLHSMVQLNMMEEEFHACRMEEWKHAGYFAMRCEIDHEQDKEKREEERAWKHEKARHAKETFAWDGEQALIKGKWQHLTQDWHTIQLP
jgi:hypothetical protein